MKNRLPNHTFISFIYLRCLTINYQVYARSLEGVRLLGLFREKENAYLGSLLLGPQEIQS